MCAISVGKKCIKNSMKERRKIMAYKKKTSITQMKFDVMEKLALHGIDTEEKLKKLKPKELIGWENLSFKEIDLIRMLQECVNENMLFSFLTLNMRIDKEESEPEKQTKKKKENSEVISDGE